MFSRPFSPDRFLRCVYGTEPFVDFCRRRQVPFEQNLSATLQPGDLRRWSAALAQLPHERHAQVELELATVNEMADADAVAHLVEAAGEGQLPPDSVPGRAPVALWFFLHHPDLFHEVFLHLEIQEVGSWRTAKATAGLALTDLQAKAGALAEALRQFFRLREGTGRFCSVNAHRLAGASCFVAQIADRLQFFDTFTESGRPTRQRLRPALPLLFVYYPRDGTVLLKSHLRSRERTAELFGHFGRAALDTAVVYDAAAFDLEILKRPFHPLPDRQDMELVRVKTLHLRYPERDGRRQLRLATLAGDGTDAIDRLMQEHVAAVTLAQLRVCHAELQVRLRVAGRGRNYLIRLWPHRCNLSQTPLGGRFRDCLRRWGLSHAG